MFESVHDVYGKDVIHSYNLVTNSNEICSNS